MTEEQNNSQPQAEEKDTTWKRIKRGFKILLEKAKTTANAINEKQNSQESKDFFNVNLTNNNEQIVEEKSSDKKDEPREKDKNKKQEKDPFDIDLDNIAKCDI